MLEHLGQNEVACRLYNAWAKTIEDGIHTYDIYKEGISQKQVGTQEFAQAVVDRMGQLPTQLTSKKPTGQSTRIEVGVRPRASVQKTLRGVDLFLESSLPSEAIANQIQSKLRSHFELKLIANRGIGTWPVSQPETLCVDHWRLRLMAKGHTSQKEILQMLEALPADMNFSQMHFLFDYDGKPGYTLGQGDQ